MVNVEELKKRAGITEGAQGWEDLAFKMYKAYSQQDYEYFFNMVEKLNSKQAMLVGIHLASYAQNIDGKDALYDITDALVGNHK